MCGIVGYIGHQKASDIIINGLKLLEYRGYDSAGIVTNESGHLLIQKKAGKVKDLEKILNFSSMQSNIGIGHTRWATHGEPNDVNAHPHTDSTGKIALVHNGIIENYTALRKMAIPLLQKQIPKCSQSLSALSMPMVMISKLPCALPSMKWKALSASA